MKNLCQELRGGPHILGRRLLAIALAATITSLARASNDDPGPDLGDQCAIDMAVPVVCSTSSTCSPDPCGMPPRGQNCSVDFDESGTSTRAVFSHCTGCRNGSVRYEWRHFDGGNCNRTAAWGQPQNGTLICEGVAGDSGIQAPWPGGAQSEVFQHNTHKQCQNDSDSRCNSVGCGELANTAPLAHTCQHKCGDGTPEFNGCASDECNANETILGFMAEPPGGDPTEYTNWQCLKLPDQGKTCVNFKDQMCRFDEPGGLVSDHGGGRWRCIE